jgi:signal transduction histidine kinase/ligand-binding sensor domain-containing protein
MKKLTLLSILSILTFTVLFSQPREYKILDRITINEELPSKGVYVIYNDSKGFMWTGLFNGLYRYDGYNLKEFSYDLADTVAHFPAGYIFCMFEDKDGIIWSGGRNGLYKYNPRESESITSKYSPSRIPWDGSSAVLAIQDDGRGNLWLGTYNGNAMPVFDKKTEKFRFEKLDPEMSDTKSNQNFWVTSIIPDSEKNLWFGTTKGLFTYNYRKESFRKFLVSPDDPSNPVNQVTTICETGPDMIWVCTMNGLYAFDKKQEKFRLVFTESSNMDKDATFPTISVKPDKTGNTWFRTTEGLYVFKNGNEELLPEKVFSYHLPYIWNSLGLDFDPSGNVWLGTQNEGIKILTPERRIFRILQPEPDDKDNIIAYPSCVYEDDKENIWIGTVNLGVYKYNKKQNHFIHYQHNEIDSNSLSANNVSYIFQDHSGTLWIGTYGSGLNKMIISSDNQIQFKRYLHDPDNHASISGNQIFKIFEDGENNLWISSNSSFLNQYDRQNDRFIHLDCGTADAVFDEMQYDKEEYDHEIIYPSWVHIYRIIPPFTQTSDHTIKARKIIKYKPGSPYKQLWGGNLTNHFVISRSEGQKVVWFGTKNGLGKMTVKQSVFTNNCYIQFKYYTEENGLNGNYINGILEDRKGNVWVTTRKGLSMFNPQTGLFTNYFMVKDIWSTGGGYLSWEPFITRQGLMCFPDYSGILIFNPDSIQIGTNVPHVYITDFKLFNKSIPPGKNSPLERPVTYSKEIKLRYNQNHLTFEYVALDYTDSKRNQYKYKMEGLDKDWILAGNIRTANYSSLKPGKYTFRVQGSNSYGVWNTEGASIKVFIRPPWWKTIVAYISYIVLIFLLIGGYVKLHTWRLRKEKDELEKMVKERTHQIQEANEELLQQKEEIQTTLEHLKQTQEQLIVSEKMAALGGLVAGVAHEINTPVGITITAASNLKAETEKMAKLYKENKISRAEFMEYMNASNQTVSLILSNMERTATMIQSFKQVSVDQSTEQKRTFKLKSYTEDVIRSLYPKLKKRKVHINLEIDEELEIDSYPGAYSQIITNLVLNSITHGFDEKHRGKIDLKVMHENGELIMEYKDNGKGIPKENQKRIYDPFFTTNKKIGTGLGMHIVYNLVTQKLRGRIECISSPCQGVIFKMQMPVK